MSNETKAMPEMSAETRLLIARMKEAKRGELITYEELSTIANVDIQGEKRYFLRTACERLRRDDRKVFEAVRNVGMKCLDDEGLASCGATHLKRVRSTAQRGAQKLTCVEDFEGLSNQTRIEHNTSLSMLGAILQASSRKNIDVVRRVISKGTDTLPKKEALRLLR